MYYKICDICECRILGGTDWDYGKLTRLRIAILYFITYLAGERRLGDQEIRGKIFSKTNGNFTGEDFQKVVGFET